MSVVLPIVGALLVLVTLREVFHMLFHPSGQGGLTILVFRAVWRLAGRLGARARSLAGPLATVLVIALWIGALCVGFALVYWPSMPEAFTYPPTADARTQDDAIDALYYSAVTQTTLGYGDVTPDLGVFRALAPLQAALGFSLFTLFITWVLSIYPALQRQRTAASTLHALRVAHERTTPPAETHPSTLTLEMQQVAQLLDSLRADFVQYPSTFYFAAPARTMNLARALPFATALARTEGLAAETRPAAAQLEASLDLLAGAIAEQHLRLRDAGTDETLGAYRRHHGLDEDGDR